MNGYENTPIRKTLKYPAADYTVMFIARFFYALLTSVELYYFAAFLTDTAAFSLAVTAALLIITTAADMILTGFYHSIMERIGRHLPWGMTRSWLIIAPPAATASFALAFSGMGSGGIVSALIVLVGFIISHIAWSVGEQAMNAQVQLMTDEAHQRRQLSANISRGTWASTLAFGYAGAAFLFLMPGDRFVFVWMIAAFGLLYWIGYILLFWRSYGSEPDRAAYEAEEQRISAFRRLSRRNITLTEAYRGMLKDHRGHTVLVIIFVSYCVEFITCGLMYYFFKYSLDALEMMPLNMTLRAAFTLAGYVFFMPLLLGVCRGSKRRALIWMQIVAVALPLVCFHPAVRTHVWMIIWISAFQAFFTGSGIYMNLSVLSDVCTAVTHQTGKDFVSHQDSLVMFPVKAALVLRSVIIVLVLWLSRYSAGTAVTGRQITGFAAGYLVAAALLNIIPLVGWIIYRLPEREVRQMAEENHRDETADLEYVEKALAKEASGGSAEKPPAEKAPGGSAEKYSAEGALSGDDEQS